MTQYPDTDAYLISYGHGTSGSFVASLVYDFLFNPNHSIPFSKQGDSHDRLENCYKNWQGPNDYINHENRHSMGTVYNFVHPVDPSIPLIILDHNFPNFDELFSIYPRCKVVIISVTLADVPRIRKNIFYKILGTTLDISQERYNKIKINGDYMNLDLVCPPKYSKDIFVLPMYDIIHHKEKTLSLLSQVTKKPINKKIRDIYDDYIKAQDNLIKTKLPWATN